MEVFVSEKEINHNQFSLNCYDLVPISDNRTGMKCITYSPDFDGEQHLEIKSLEQHDAEVRKQVIAELEEWSRNYIDDGFSSTREVKYDIFAGLRHKLEQIETSNLIEFVTKKCIEDLKDKIDDKDHHIFELERENEQYKSQLDNILKIYGNDDVDKNILNLISENAELKKYKNWFDESKSKNLIYNSNEYSDNPIIETLRQIDDFRWCDEQEFNIIKQENGDLKEKLKSAIVPKFKENQWVYVLENNKIYKVKLNKPCIEITYDYAYNCKKHIDEDGFEDVDYDIGISDGNNFYLTKEEAEEKRKNWRKTNEN